MMHFTCCYQCDKLELSARNCCDHSFRSVITIIVAMNIAAIQVRGKQSEQYLIHTKRYKAEQ